MPKSGSHCLSSNRTNTLSTPTLNQKGPHNSLYNRLCLLDLNCEQMFNSLPHNLKNRSGPLFDKGMHPPCYLINNLSIPHSCHPTTSLPPNTSLRIIGFARLALNPVAGARTSLRRSSWSSANRRSAAARLDSNCDTVRAPINVELTPRLAIMSVMIDPLAAVHPRQRYFIIRETDAANIPSSIWRVTTAFSRPTPMPVTMRCLSPTERKAR